MQTKPLFLIIVSFFYCVQPSFAGFITNRHVVLPEPVAGSQIMSGLNIGDSVRMNSRTRCFNEDYRARRRRHYGEGGWAGIVSYICACTFVLGPLAVIFGAIGLSRTRNHYWAVKGFVYGIISTVVLAAIFISIFLF